MKERLARIGPIVGLAVLMTLRWIANNEREVVMFSGLALVFGGIAMISWSAALIVAGFILILLAWPPVGVSARSRE